MKIKKNFNFDDAFKVSSFKIADSSEDKKNISPKSNLPEQSSRNKTAKSRVIKTEDN